ncbi:MAG: Holliday junction branch migration protein RuvA [Sphingomonadaceae bacterium]
MIASLRGVAAMLAADHAIIEVQGVGYLVQASTRTLGQLTAQEPAFLYIDTQVREDAITLFGFAAMTERDWFRHLTSVQGVGGKVALAILSTLSGDELAQAIATQDKAMVARANGVGPRLATRIVTELKGKVAALPVSGVTAPAATSSAARDAVSALEHLGFRPMEAAKAVAEAEAELGSAAGVNEVIRVALRKAGRS